MKKLLLIALVCLPNLVQAWPVDEQETIGPVYSEEGTVAEPVYGSLYYDTYPYRGYARSYYGGSYYGSPVRQTAREALYGAEDVADSALDLIP